MLTDSLSICTRTTHRAHEWDGEPEADRDKETETNERAVCLLAPPCPTMPLLFAGPTLEEVSVVSLGNALRYREPDDGICSLCCRSQIICRFERQRAQSDGSV